MDMGLRPGLAGVIERIERLSVTATLTLASLLVVVVVSVDVLTGPEISFSIFYVAPVSLVAERLGRLAGLTAAVVAATAWYLVDLSDNEYSKAVIPVWNGLVRLGFFALIATMTVMLRDVMSEQAEQARVDALTNLLNRRGFAERGAIEVSRARRTGEPLTIAYLDLDGFKHLNDVAGHAAGDDVLRSVGAAARSRLRDTDVAGRLGGDEFAFLLPETSAEEARVVVETLHAELAAGADPRVGFSFGVVTFDSAPADIEAALGVADDLMYQAKSERPGGIHFEIA
jgi:diguanylate cyclase (GGDEF)-like protein